MTKPYEGTFITIEGGDGTGKSTITEQLASALRDRGYPIVRTREPGGTPLSEKVRSLILRNDPEISIAPRTELLLFLAARAQHLEESIIPDLRAGKLVLCERYNDSSIAYQGAARHLGVEEVTSICQLATSGLTPDCTILLDMDPAEALERLSSHAKDRLEQEKLQFHKEVRQAFLHLADEHPERIRIVDAGKPPSEVVAKALQALETFLPAVRS